MGGSSNLTRVILLPVLAAVVYNWLSISPKVDWTRTVYQDGMDHLKCPEHTTQTMVIFGGTSMLGKYIVDSFVRDKSLCLVNYGRSKCAQCSVNVKGDLRDTRHVERIVDHFKADTVLTSVKPPLLGIHYKVYIELNLLSMLELIKSAKKHGVRNFLYVSSIAASSHYINHTMSDESLEQPKFTDYEAPYDVSKRVAEDFLLAQHEPGIFNTIAIRTSGIIGGEGDPYFYFRLPFIVTFNLPAVVDSNYAANIGDALVVVFKTLQKNPQLGGQFYYYTGEHNPERMLAEYAAAGSGKPILELPIWLLYAVIEWWSWSRWEHNIYTTLDLLRMAVIPQNFDQSKFHGAFPDFKPKYTMKQAMVELYGTQN